jgi:predicted Na+-dependent transporter
LTAVFLPLSLFTVMLGMGLGLRVDDFARVLVYSKAIAIASAPTLLNQPDLAIPAAIYSLLMFATGAVFAGWATRRGSGEKTLAS